MGDTPIPAFVLKMDAAATARYSLGSALERPAPGTKTKTMKLQFQGGSLPVQVKFVTPWAKSPPAIHVAGFQLNNVVDFTMAYDPAVDPYRLGTGQTMWMTVGPGSWIVLTCPLTGGLVGVYQLPKEEEDCPDPMVIPLGELSLQHMATNIDAPPDEFTKVNLQREPLPIMVNFTADQTAINMGQSPKFVVVQEQYWKLGGITCTLAPKEVRHLSFIRTIGRLDSTTTQDQLQTSLSLSVSGSASWGWGSISAAISASFSSSHSVTQTTSITSSATTIVRQMVENLTSDVVSILEWQLIDRFSICGAGQPPAVIETAQPASLMRMFPPSAAVSLKSLAE